MEDALRESLRAGLAAEAARRFGAARAAALGAEIDALARDLAAVQAAEIPDEVEPGFFLLDPGPR
jgi:plasmid stability protein